MTMHIRAIILKRHCMEFLTYLLTHILSVHFPSPLQFIHKHILTHTPPTPTRWRNKTVITKINLTFCPSSELRLMKRWRRMHHLGHTVYRSWCSWPCDTRCWTLASNFPHLQLNVKGIRSTDAGAFTPASFRVHLLTLRFGIIFFKTSFTSRSLNSPYALINH